MLQLVFDFVFNLCGKNKFNTIFIPTYILTTVPYFITSLVQILYDLYIKPMLILKDNNRNFVTKVTLCYK